MSSIVWRVCYTEFLPPNNNNNNSNKTFRKSKANAIICHADDSQVKSISSKSKSENITFAITQFDDNNNQSAFEIKKSVKNFFEEAIRNLISILLS